MQSHRLKQKATLEFISKSCQLNCIGQWQVAELASLEHQLQNIEWGDCRDITIDGSKLTHLDTSGAWLLCSLQEKFTKQHINVKFSGLNEQHQSVIDLVTQDKKQIIVAKKPKRLTRIEEIGKLSLGLVNEGERYLEFIGKTAKIGLRVLKNPEHVQWKSLFSVVEIAGYKALPIIAVLSFMIGVVLTYQMGLQLKNYGANIFIVDLLGLAILREFGSLITAIMVAGRTGSAFTAQLGTMQLNEEIDALRVMGITPEELLIIPRILGLFISLPLLTMWANIWGILGGMVMSKGMLGISWYDFLQRFQQEVSLSSLNIGLGKSLIFALIIASIGCFQGLEVRGGADSVGKQTTKSVVQSIFMIIIADAIFSVIFSKLNI